MGKITEVMAVTGVNMEVITMATEEVTTRTGVTTGVVMVEDTGVATTRTV